MNDEHDSGNLFSALLDMLALPTRSVYSGTRNLLRGDLKGAIPLGVGLGSGLATLASGGGAGLAGLIGAIGGGAFQGLGEAIDPERMKVGQLADVLNPNDPTGTHSLPMPVELIAGALAGGPAFGAGAAGLRGLGRMAGRAGSAAGGGALSSKLAGMMQGPMGMAEKVGDKFDDLSNWLSRPSAPRGPAPSQYTPRGNTGRVPTTDPLEWERGMNPTPWQSKWQDPWAAVEAPPPPLPQTPIGLLDEARPLPGRLELPMQKPLGMLPDEFRPAARQATRGHIGDGYEFHVDDPVFAAMQQRGGPLPPLQMPPGAGQRVKVIQPQHEAVPMPPPSMQAAPTALGFPPSMQSAATSLDDLVRGQLATLPQAPRPMSVGSSWQKALDDALRGTDDIIDAEFTVRGPMRSLPAPPKSIGASLQDALKQAKGQAEPAAAARSTMPGSSWKDALKEARKPKGEKAADRIAMIKEAAEKRKASKGYKTFQEDTKDVRAKVETATSGQMIDKVLEKMVGEASSPREMENIIASVGRTFHRVDPKTKQGVAATMQRLIQQWGKTKRVPDDYMRELLGSVQPLFKSKRG